MADEPLLPKIEEKILKFWTDRDIFQKSLQNRLGAKRFVFFEGPPTANAVPGIHHLIGRAFKDIFLRYKTMHGYFVMRKAGWDTHGLPVEIAVEKELGLKNKKDIEDFGIAKFNAKARENVWKHKEQWEKFTERIGFWLDNRHPYITYETDYIETLWWIIKEINKKGFLYEGHKVLPWCTRCGTALSSHEVAQGYRDVTDTSVYVKFKLKLGQRAGKIILPENISILAWTTTPWTLPGNLALAVGKDIDYVLVELHGEKFIVAENVSILKEQNIPTFLNKFKGKDLVGLKYEPLFDVPALQSEKSYQVYAADFVTTTDGTGIVHTAVMYGEDDYELGKKIDLPTIHTVNENGKFNDSISELAGRYVKDPKTEQAIIGYLESHNLLFKKELYAHSYPFCWRCNTTLLYYAKDSWFVAMSKLRKQLIKNNRKVNWVPDHLRDGRFGEFIKEAKDWAFSRERYWGTPLPVWRCSSLNPLAGGDKCNAHMVIGSLQELEERRYRGKNQFFLMRHGHSQKDTMDEDGELIASKLKYDKYQLLDDGIKLIEEQADRLKKQGGVDLIVASPFLRTQETAKLIADKIGIKYVSDERLGELDHGLECEGKPGNFCPLEKDSRTMDNKKHDDGETWRETRSRMFKAVKELNDKYENMRILIVSHGDPLWLLETGLMGFDDNKTLEARNSAFYLKQGEFHQVNFKNWPFDEQGNINPHRPYIDEITLKCEKCGGEAKRVKEVVDVWFDSGAMPYAQWHHPFDPPGNGRNSFKQNFPADFISEGIDQTRGWFYTMLSVSTLLGNGAPYKNVVSYSHVLDENGRKMSKSLGNTIDPWEVINQFGVDATRWYFYLVNNPGESKMFSLKNSLKQPKAFVGTLLNSLNFFELYNKPSGRQIKPKLKPQKLLDSWLLSRLNNTLIETTKALDNYNVTSASRGIEAFIVNDLSNWWIRRSRELFQRPEDKKAFQNTIDFLQYVLIELSKMTAPFMPFLSDHIYKRLGSFKESVHLEDWPKPKKKFINLNLEKQMIEARNVIAIGLAKRKTNNIKVRQPLASLMIKRFERFDPQLEQLILAELNIKKILYSSSITESAILDIQITSELALEGYARELMRQIQDMRKEAQYKIDDQVFLLWESDNEDVASAFNKFENEIRKTAVLKESSRGHDDQLVFDIEKEFELSPSMKVWLGIRK